MTQGSFNVLGVGGVFSQESSNKGVLTLSEQSDRVFMDAIRVFILVI